MRTLKWFFIAAPILNILILLTTQENFLKWLPSELAFIAIAIILLYFCYWKNYTCPECRKLFALKKTKEEVIGQENVSVLVETKMRDTRQNVVGTSEQYVPGVKTTYREYYTCKNCGNTFTQDYTKRTPKV